jgi:integrase
MTEPTISDLARRAGGELVEAGPQPLDQNPAAVYLAQLAPGSRRTMREALNTIAEMLGVSELCDADGRDVRCLAAPWSALRYQHTSKIRSDLAERYAPATANKILVALRRTLKEAWRLGLLSAEDYHRAADVRQIKEKRLPRGRALADAEIAALLSTCAADPSVMGARDAAVIALLRGAGLRRSEVVKLDLANYDPANDHAITIRSGKGRKDRIVYLPEGAAAALADWLALRGDTPGPLFYPIAKGGKIQPRRMTDQAVLLVLQKRAVEARVRTFSPHDLRRTFISDLLDRGADIATVQRLAGHDDPNTTSKYDRRGEVAKKRAIGHVFVPHYPRPSDPRSAESP